MPRQALLVAVWTLRVPPVHSGGLATQPLEEAQIQEAPWPSGMHGSILPRYGRECTEAPWPSLSTFQDQKRRGIPGNGAGRRSARVGRACMKITLYM